MGYVKLKRHYCRCGKWTWSSDKWGIMFPRISAHTPNVAYMCEKCFYKNNKRGGWMKKVRYYYRCAKWLFKNREWSNTRQKFKAMLREVER